MTFRISLTIIKENEMKKLFVLALMIMGTMCFAGGTQDASSKTRQAAYDAQQNAFVQNPVPNVQYFTERKTISEWVKRWDKPSVITYVYLVSYGNVLGYYVCNGKPASTQSYLIPEETVDYRSCGGHVMQAPDLDGTYGSNNPGIRFFTAEGTAVEWAGSGASYIYSDAPLPLNVPKLNVTKK